MFALIPIGDGGLLDRWQILDNAFRYVGTDNTKGFLFTCINYGLVLGAIVLAISVSWRLFKRYVR